MGRSGWRWGRGTPSSDRSRLLALLGSELEGGVAAEAGRLPQTKQDV
jgi:hypothetical protein